MSGVILMK